MAGRVHGTPARHASRTGRSRRRKPGAWDGRLWPKPALDLERGTLNRTHRTGTASDAGAPARGGVPGEGEVVRVHHPPGSYSLIRGLEPGVSPGSTDTQGRSTAVEIPWKGRTGAPSLPDNIPLPPPTLGQPLKWHELGPAGTGDDATLFLTFTGDGRAPDGLLMGWLYIVAGPSGELNRWPTLEEIYSAGARAPFKGAIFELPPFVPKADPLEELEAGEAALLHFRQSGAVQGSEAFHRFNLSAQGGGIIQTPGGPHGPQ